MLTPSATDEALRSLLGVVVGGGGPQRGWWCRWLAERSAKELLRLDDRARASSWSTGPLGSSIEWASVDLNRKDGLSAAIASLHPDGRLREEAVRLMRGHPRFPAIPFLALRAVDHVQQIRAIACEGLLSRIEVEDAQLCLPVLHAASRRDQGLSALDTYGQALWDRHGTAAAVELTGNTDLATRRAAYAVCLGQNALPVEVVGERIEVETDQVSKSLLTEHFIGSAPPSQVRDRLLHGAYIEGRLQALYLIDERELTAADIKQRLMDRSPRVREAAQWRARRAGLRPETFYWESWQDRDDSPTITYVLLEGLRQTGQTLDVGSLRTCLASEYARVRLAALKMWVGDQQDKDMLLHLLSDPSPKVSAAAAAQLSRVAITLQYEDLADCAASSQRWTRRAAWRVRRELSSWDRLLGDLELQDDPDPELAILARNDLLEWLLRQAPITYASPSRAQRDAIEAALESADLETHLLVSIAFHAGIPPLHTAAPGTHPRPQSALTRLRKRLRINHEE